MGIVTPDHKSDGITANLVRMSKRYNKTYTQRKISRYYSVLDEMRSLCNKEQLEHIDSIIYFIRCASELIIEENR